MPTVYQFTGADDTGGRATFEAGLYAASARSLYSLFHQANWARGVRGDRFVIG